MSTSLEQAEQNERSVVTVADDTNVAMILVYHWNENHGEVIFFQEKSNKGWKMNEICWACDLFREHILFVHAFSGCVTTSAPFGRGKSNFLSLVIKSKEMQIVSETMNGVWAEQHEVGEAAVTAFQIVYSGKDQDSLCKVR